MSGWRLDDLLVVVFGPAYIQPNLSVKFKIVLMLIAVKSLNSTYRWWAGYSILNSDAIAINAMSRHYLNDSFFHVIELSDPLKAIEARPIKGFFNWRGFGSDAIAKKYNLVLFNC